VVTKDDSLKMATTVSAETLRNPVCYLRLTPKKTKSYNKLPVRKPEVKNVMLYPDSAVGTGSTAEGSEFEYR
jgi:hypothetical protein